MKKFKIPIDLSNTFYKRSVCKYCGGKPSTDNTYYMLGNQSKAIYRLAFSNSKLKYSYSECGNIFNVANPFDWKEKFRPINIHVKCALTKRVKKMTKGPNDDNLFRERMKINTSKSFFFVRKRPKYGCDILPGNIISCQCGNTIWMFAMGNNINEMFGRSKELYKNTIISL